ncbi:hypothetical protein BDR26DRAFT_933850 [Obelidium mucronatum]|nr:hypothetical protein BDR26DRAFT_933850 [Obelidium mucronatum]
MLHADVTGKFVDRFYYSGQVLLQCESHALAKLLVVMALIEQTVQKPVRVLQMDNSAKFIYSLALSASVLLVLGAVVVNVATVVDLQDGGSNWAQSTLLWSVCNNVWAIASFSIIAEKRERVNSFDYQPLLCMAAEHMEAVQKFFVEPSTTIEKTAKKYGGKSRVSVGHVKDYERNYEEFGFCYSPFDRFLPGVFLVVWSCGNIMDIGKMYLFESNKFITGFLCQTFMRLDEYPTFMFYDKACVFVRTLKNGAQQNKLLHK